ncbi:glycosyltransferase family 4 protein [Glutamicibacter ardleyensis]|uniref:glycosyltransferase family 4 protein n=1 Tax=Glutamicibacter ardleyensis TaxID=225894 RepID=UPI003FD5A46B
MIPILAVLYPFTIRNLLNASHLVIQNLADDPQYFCLQVARKFATSSHLRILRRLENSSFASSKFGGFTALLSEDRGAVAEHVENHYKLWRHPTKAARLADTAIATQLWDLAKRILEVAPTTRSTVKSKARLEYALGNFDEAIKILETNVGGSASRQLRHYRSEREVFESWEPVLESKKRDWKRNGNPVVLYVATNSLPFTSSGYTQRTHSLLTTLQENGVAVHAATRVGYPLSIGHILAGAHSEIDGITYHRLLPSFMKFDAAGKIQQQVQMLAELVQELKPTVLHTTTDFTNALAVRAVARAFDLPWVYEVRGQLADTWASTRPTTAQNSQRYRQFKLREAEMAASADAVMTLGETMRRNLVDSGIATNNITVIPNGVGRNYLQLPPGKKETRLALGLDVEAEYFGTISSLVDYEGLEILVRTLAKVSESRPNLRLLIVGDGVEREPLMRLARDLDVAHLCNFPGRVPRDDAALYHAALDVFALPRKDLPVTRDVTPLKPVEAMASGVPVLASKLPAVEELVLHQENGLLVSPNDLAQWCEGLELLLDDPSLSRRLGQSARKYVMESRTWRACSLKLKHNYSR